MAILKFRSKEEFESFVNEENKPKQPETPKAAPALTAEQVSKNSHEYMKKILEKERAAIFAARKAPAQKTQPQNIGGNRCTDCKHLIAETSFCNLIGKKQANPKQARQCGYYNL